MLAACPDCPVQYLEEEDNLPEMDLARGKETLYLTRFKGRFLKPCPGTDESYRCCNYLVINESTNCPIDCTYCILQGYITNPAITIYTNYRKILEEIRLLSAANPQRILRIGTGELTDSLALDPITHLSEKLVREIQTLPNVLLELKSKTDHIDHLLSLPPERVVLSWSVNPSELVKSDEKKATPVHRRLAAARKAVEKGFLIGFHFDPLLMVKNWEKLYPQLIEEMGKAVPPERIAWISLGSLRFPPHLKEIIRGRFPDTTILSGEQVPGQDGKMRYIRPLRQKLYGRIAEVLNRHLPGAFVYFCMESEQIWRQILHRSPENNLAVDFYFADSLYRRFPELNFPKPTPEIYSEDIVWPTLPEEV
ncbi:MAG: hypothetical protein Kow0037_26880 [Calditrichia bacterium]